MKAPDAVANAGDSANRDMRLEASYGPRRLAITRSSANGNSVALRPPAGRCYSARHFFEKNGAARMKPYDILMLIVLALTIVWGAWKGLAWQIASIASIGLSYRVALHFRLPLARIIN